MESTDNGAALERIPPQESARTLVTTTHKATILAEALKEDSEQRQLLARFVKDHMLEGTDYGTIPGTDRLVRTPDGKEQRVSPRTLLKPGAEKLVDLYRCTAKYKIRRIEDWEKGFFHYEFRCYITSRETNTVLAEGFGSANSKEGRYRWRNAARKCPECGKECIIKGKAEYGGGWLCFAKKGGCGAKFGEGDPKIEGQEQGRVENDDIYTQANSILKIAKKRALVDASIALARCSDMFTQDLEDFIDGEVVLKATPPPKSEEPGPQPEKTASGTERRLPIKDEPTTAPQSQGARAVDSAHAANHRARVQVLWAKAKKVTTLEAYKEWCKGVLGYDKASADWTPDDLSNLENSIAEFVASRTK